MTSTGSPYQIMRGQVHPEATIIALGGGKGGIGKSFVSSSLAIFLGHLGYNTYVIDLDLGGANLHTSLGEGLPKMGIHDFIQNPKLGLEEVASTTAFPHLKLIGGWSEGHEPADLTNEQRTRLMSSIYKLKADFILLDLSAGTHNTTLDFFLMANHKVVVFTPEPSSIENAYRFLKASFYRKIRRFEEQLHLEGLINELMSQKGKLGLRSPADLLKAIHQHDPEKGQRLQALMSDLSVKIILNQTRTIKDADLGPSIQGVSNRYFGIPSQYLGHVDHDNAVWQALRKRRHLITEYPHSRVYAQLMAIARRLAAPARLQAMIG